MKQQKRPGHRLPGAETAKRRVHLLLRRVGIEVRRWPPPPKGPGRGFYAISPTCQIDNLSHLYEVFLGRRPEGTFVEVGAFDGYTYSNTSGLVAAGWRGFYIEPVPVSAERCRRRYERDAGVVVDELAIGDHEGRIEIFVGAEFSTSSPTVREEYLGRAWAQPEFAGQEVVEVRQTTLDQYLAGHAIDPGFDLLVVDVEGGEVEVFAGFDLARWRPRMMIVELFDTQPGITSNRMEHARLGRRLRDAGYVVVAKDAINTVLVRDDVYEAAFAD